MMDQLIRDFTSHLSKALEIGKETSFKENKQEIKNVLICGLGGSGIGGTLISQLLSEVIQVPIVVNKNYSIPAFVDQHTLVLCCSYSGNTEETLAMYKLAKKTGAEISIISSGGAFAKIAAEEGLNRIEIPGGLPPRAAFGLSFPQLFFVLAKYQLINTYFIAEFEQAISLLNQEEENIQNLADEIAKKLHGKIPAIYSEARWDGVSVRFRQQLNENSKMLGWNNVIPEMNHNELVGWSTSYPAVMPIFFTSESDYYRNQEREKYSKSIIEKHGNTLLEVKAKGDSYLVQALYLIHTGDWISYRLAELKQIDSVEVDVITGLKNMLEDLA